MTKLHNLLTLICFILIISFFLINQVTHFVEDKNYDENKKKAEMPVFDVNYLDNYPSQFESYFTDNFSLRGFFLKEMGKINTKVWKKSPKPDKLIIGEGNWLYNVDKELDSYYGKRNFSIDELQAVLAEFNYRKRILDSMGIEMLFVINPTKYSVYPEYLPYYIIRNTKLSPAIQLKSYFESNSSIEVIYSKEYLLPQKEHALLYYKGDNHWNEIGGYYAGKGILSNVNILQKWPEIAFAAFCIDTTDYIGNLAYMAADANAYIEIKPNLTLCENDAVQFKRFEHHPIEGFPYPEDYHRSYKSINSDRPNALIIMDSFGNMTIPYMKNTFYHSTFIFDAWQYKFNLDIIEKEKPDVVIYMVLESLLPNLYTAGLSNK